MTRRDIRPKTAGEFLAILEAGRENEIDPQWLEEVLRTSSEIIILFGLKPTKETEDEQ